MTTAATSAMARLQGIAGASHVIADPAALAAYEVDGVRPRAAVRPGSADEAAEVVGMAAAEKLAVIACGARTHLGIGGIPSRYEIALDLSRLNRVIAYDPGDLTLGVEAGVTLATLNDTLQQHGQFLPLFVPFMMRATIGGTLAAGVDSPLRQHYGTARDFLLGVESIDGAGTRVKSGSRVVKCVAGFDLHKLHLGALGTLGVITAANFRTFPAFPESRGLLASFRSAEEALDMRRRIAESPLTPLTLEVLSPEMGELFGRDFPESLGERCGPAARWFPAGHWTLAAALGGHAAVMERQERELTRIAELSGATGVARLGPEERPAVWARLREALPLVQAYFPGAAIYRISVLPGEFLRLIGALAQIGERAGRPTAMALRGVGVLYFSLLARETGANSVESQARASAAVFQAAAAVGGNAVVSWCPTELKQKINVWGAPRGDFDLMQRLKNVFDPGGILAPGRFVGGL